jgi:hypothetical protein
MRRAFDQTDVAMAINIGIMKTTTETTTETTTIYRMT